MPIITAIEPQKRRQKRFSIFIDEEFFLGVSEDVLKQASLRVGMEIDPKTLEALAEKEDYNRARDYLLKLLSRRIYSCEEVRLKLHKRETAETIAEKLISDFTKRRFLDDRQFAADYVENRLRMRPRGIQLIRMELLRKGIDPELIRVTVQPYLGREEQLEYALQALGKKKNYKNEADLRKRKQKITRFLAQKGFPPEVIFETIRRILGRSTEFEE
jgi:regulatory protein